MNYSNIALIVTLISKLESFGDAKRYRCRMTLEASAIQTAASPIPGTIELPISIISLCRHGRMRGDNGRNPEIGKRKQRLLKESLCFVFGECKVINADFPLYSSSTDTIPSRLPTIVSSFSTPQLRGRRSVKMAQALCSPLAVVCVIWIFSTLTLVLR